MANTFNDPNHELQRAKPIMQVASGSIRPCATYGGEIARHRVLTADGHDYIVATTQSLPTLIGGDQRLASTRRPRFVTGAYPVSRGYLVMMRQPLCEMRSDEAATACEQHDQLTRVLAEAGVGVVRARRTLVARRNAEAAEAQRSQRESAVSLTDSDVRAMLGERLIVTAR